MKTGLKGRTVIITGASRNIGARAAELFCRGRMQRQFAQVQK